MKNKQKIEKKAKRSEGKKNNGKKGDTKKIKPLANSTTTLRQI